jgi:hypothetical protein
MGLRGVWRLLERVVGAILVVLFVCLLRFWRFWIRLVVDTA